MDCTGLCVLAGWALYAIFGVIFGGTFLVVLMAVVVFFVRLVDYLFSEN